jgi:hypothetical protein
VSVEGWWSLLSLSLSVGDYAKAEIACKEIVSTDQGNTRALTLLAVIAVHQQKFSLVCFVGVGLVDSLG